MEEKRILIIGAGSQSKKDSSIKGIGTCLVERLSREKHLSILFTYCNNEEGANELVKRVTLENTSCELNILRFNSLNYQAEWQNLDYKLQEFGTPNIFVYNAGIRFYKDNLTDSEKEATMKVNYLCPIFLIDKIGEKMIQEHKQGKIILTNSILAGKHHPFLEEYCSSKGLLDRYVQEHKDYWRNKGIEIKVVSPNLTRTPMIEEQIEHYEEEFKQGKRTKIISPEKIAEEIASLCL